MSLVSEIRQGMAYVLEGLRAYAVWAFLAWFDTRQRYKRSAIGPFWLTISMAISIGCLGGLYSVLFNIESRSFLPSVAIGLVLWTFISQTLRESCYAFIESGALIKQVRLPVTAFVFRVLYRNLIFLAHHLIIVAGVLLWSGVSSAAGVLASIIGLVFFVFVLFWVCLAFAVLSARFRDVPLIVENILQLVFYMTPIAWMPQMLGDPYRVILDLNPIFYAIEIIRAPLIHDLPNWAVYTGALGIGLVCICVGAVAAGRSVKSVPYWV